MNKIGFALGYDPKATVREMARAVAGAEEAGFDMAFFSETLYTNRDSASAMTAFALAANRIQLGTTQVVRLRTPLVMAQTAATIDELSGGQFALTVGACTDKHAARNGLPPQGPPKTLREYIHSIRLLLSGEAISFDGEFVKFKDVGLNWKPRRADIPIWIAGASRIGLKIAGELGDGILFDAGLSPEYTANALAIVRAAREAAGRSMDGFTVAQLINVSIEDTKRAAIDAVRWEIASKFRYASTWKAKLVVGEPNVETDAPERLSKLYEEKGLDALVAAIPDSYVEALTAIGTIDDVASRLGQYRAAGVNMPLMRTANQGQMPRLFESGRRLREA